MKAPIYIFFIFTGMLIFSCQKDSKNAFDPIKEKNKILALDELNKQALLKAELNSKSEGFMYNLKNGIYLLSLRDR